MPTRARWRAGGGEREERDLAPAAESGRDEDVADIERMDPLLHVLERTLLRKPKLQRRFVLLPLNVIVSANSSGRFRGTRIQTTADGFDAEMVKKNN